MNALPYLLGLLFLLPSASDLSLPSASGLSLPSGSDVPLALELEEALKLADRYDARFETLAFQEQAALWQSAAAAAQVLPSLSLETSITRNAREIKIGAPPDERIVSPLFVPRASASGRFALLRGPDLPAAFAAWKRYGAVQREAAESRDALRADVAMLFLALAQLQAVARAERSSVQTAKALLEIARARVRRGEGLPLEVADAEAEALRVQAALALTEGDTEATLSLFRLRLGLAEDRDVVTHCENCIIAPADGDPMRLQDRRGDLAGLQQRAWAARADEAAGWASLLPTLEVVANARLQQPTLFSPDPIWWTAQLVLRWDVLGPNPRGSGLLRSIALDRTAAGVRNIAIVATSEARAAVLAARARSLASEQGFLASQARAQAAKTALEQAELRYRAGRYAASDVLAVARRKAEADRALAVSSYARLRARLTLRRALGLGPLDNGEGYE